MKISFYYDSCAFEDNKGNLKFLNNANRGYHGKYHEPDEALLELKKKIDYITSFKDEGFVNFPKQVEWLYKNNAVDIDFVNKVNEMLAKCKNDIKQLRIDKKNGLIKGQELGLITAKELGQQITKAFGRGVYARLNHHVLPDFIKDIDGTRMAPTLQALEADPKFWALFEQMFPISGILKRYLSNPDAQNRVLALLLVQEF